MDYIKLSVQDRERLVNERIRNMEQQHFQTGLDLAVKEAEVVTPNTPEAEAKAGSVAAYQRAQTNFAAGIAALKGLLQSMQPAA